MIMLENLSPNEIEQQFVKTFVIPRLQERAYYELTSPKKRGRFFSRLSCDPNLVLESKYLMKIPHLRNEKEISEITILLKKNGAEDKCYIMFDNKEGAFFFLEDGVQKSIHYPMEIILIASKRLAFVQLERVSGSPPRFLLKKN